MATEQGAAQVEEDEEGQDDVGGRHQAAAAGRFCVGRGGGPGKAGWQRVGQEEAEGGKLEVRALTGLGRGQPGAVCAVGWHQEEQGRGLGDGEGGPAGPLRVHSTEQRSQTPDQAEVQHDQQRKRFQGPSLFLRDSLLH